MVRIAVIEKMVDAAYAAMTDVVVTEHASASEVYSAVMTMSKRLTADAMRRKLDPEPFRRAVTDMLLMIPHSTQH